MIMIIVIVIEGNDFFLKFLFNLFDLIWFVV